MILALAVFFGLSLGFALLGYFLERAIRHFADEWRAGQTAHAAAIRYAAKSAGGRVKARRSEKEVALEKANELRLRPMLDWLEANGPLDPSEEGDLIGLYEIVLGDRPASDALRADARRRLVLRGVPFEEWVSQTPTPIL